jgi:branched-chain amino acid transport system ATP-binding protein
MSQNILEVRGLTKSFGGIHALSDVTFALEAGEMLALIGPNGAGKSTCFNLLMGQLRADAGLVKFCGQKISTLLPRHIWRLGIGRTFQITATYASMTVIENVQVAIMSYHRRCMSFWPRAKELYRDEAQELLHLVEMDNQADRPAAILAYGDVKRLELAVALANQPALLLLDEPTAGMGPS